MRSSLVLAVALLACGRVASAQTPTQGPARDRGYVEVVAQSAFGNVTSQNFGVEGGVTVRPNLQVFAEGGWTRDVATAEIGAAAQVIAGYLSQTQSNVAFSVKEPVTFGIAGVKYLVPITGSRLKPYVLGGAGIASVSQNVAFTIGAADVTSSLPSYGVTLGTDLSGSFTKPMIVVGGGVMWPWQRLIIDAQFRYGRIFAEDNGINLSRAGIGLGVRF